MSTKSLNFLIPYDRQWVALDNKRTKVLESDKDLRKLDKKVRSKKLKNIIFHFVQLGYLSA